MRKSFKAGAARVLACLLLLTLVLPLQGCLPYLLYELTGQRQESTSQSQQVEPTYEPTGAYGNLSFTELCDVLFEHEVTWDSLTLNQLVVDPQALDIEVPRPATLGDYSYESTLEDNRFYSEIIDALTSGETIDRTALSDQQQREATYLERVLRQTIGIDGELYYYDEPLSPSTGAQAMLPLSLMDYQFRTVDDIDIYLEILQDIPHYFDQLISYEEVKKERNILMPRESFNDTIAEAKAYIGDADTHILTSMFNEMLDKAIEEAQAASESGSAESGLSSLSLKQIQDYKSQNLQAVSTYVVPAYESLIVDLETLADYSHEGRRLVDYKRGTEYYELTMELMGFDVSASEAAKLLDETLLKNWDIIAASNSSGSIPEDIVQALGEDPEDYIAYVQEHSSAEFLSAPELSYSVKVAPDDSPNDYAMAYFLTPPVDNALENNIVFFPKNISDDVELFSTMAHEAYPGHMYQAYCYSKEEPSNISKLLGSLAYMEGWAMYAQGHGLRSLDADTEDIEVYIAYERFSYALQARVDIGINFEGWTLAGTEKYLADWGYSGAAESIYTVCIQQPVAYLPYGLGVVVFEDLRAQAEEHLGADFDPVAFNQKLTSLGPLPLDMLRTEMESWLKG